MNSQRSTVHLELDPIEYRPDTVFGLADPDVAALATVTLIYAPVPQRSEFADLFFHAAREALARDSKSGEEALDAVASASDEVFHREPLRRGSMTYTVLQKLPNAWRVINLGDHMVLRLTMEHHAHGMVPAVQVVIPAVYQGGGASRESSLRHRMTAAEVVLSPGDWLLAMRDSKGVRDLSLPALPRTPEDIRRDVIDVLAKPYAQYTRAWLGVHAHAEG